MATKEEEASVAGCLLVLYGMLILGPAYLILMFAVLQSCNVPTWAWVLYWCYVPLYLFGLLLRLVLEAITK